MALIPVQRRPRQKVSGGSSGGGRMGQGLGALIGGVAGGAAGAAGGPAGIAAGALKGAATGASLGGMAGNAISPARAPTVEQAGGSNVSTVQIASNSQAILDGLRALEDMDPGLQQEYAQPLTQAYIASMIDLKQRGNA